MLLVEGAIEEHVQRPRGKKKVGSFWKLQTVLLGQKLELCRKKMLEIQTWPVSELGFILKTV